MKRSLLALVPVTLLLASCSAPAESPAESSPTYELEGSTVWSADITEELQDAAGDAKIKATSEDGRVSVETDLVDPRGEDGSAEAKRAIKICEAAAKLDGVTYVNVTEKDGTSWILYGHPSVPKGECTEV